jgi:uncharacterized OsmC-like protein
MATDMSDLNGVDVGDITAFQDFVRGDPSRADRNPTVVARWLGGSRSEVRCGDDMVTIGGDGELNPMRMTLASLAACDVDLVAMHAALLGVEIEDLTVEAQGYFNVQRYLGLEAPLGAGYQRVRYVVRIKAPSATEAQLARLRDLCERGSPVGDTFERAISLTLEFESVS